MTVNTGYVIGIILKVADLNTSARALGQRSTRSSRLFSAAAAYRVERQQTFPPARGTSPHSEDHRNRDGRCACDHLFPGKFLPGRCCTIDHRARPLRQLSRGGTEPQVHLLSGQSVPMACGCGMTCQADFRACSGSFAGSRSLLANLKHNGNSDRELAHRRDRRKGYYREERLLQSGSSELCPEG